MKISRYLQITCRKGAGHCCPLFSTQAFQAVMSHMFFPLIGRGVIAYLDDLLVYSSDVESHAKLLDRVLQILKGNKMYPKISKSTFDSDAVEYLG